MQIQPEARGRASLEVSLVFNQSTVTAAYASSPMKLLTPRSRGPSVGVYVSNLGGGLVAGDQTRLDLQIGKGARCFVGTQASTKIYRNPSLLPCGHTTQANLDAGALLVFAPAPVQPFTDSTYVQRQQFRLAPDAGLVLLDWFTSGRRARGERWAFSHFASRNEIWQSTRCEEKPASATASLEPDQGAPTECVFLDSLILDPADGALGSTYRTGRLNCFAMLLLTGAPLEKPSQWLLEQTNHLSVRQKATMLVSASPVRKGVVLRIAGEELTDVEDYLRGCLGLLSDVDVFGEDPWCRRW